MMRFKIVAFGGLLLGSLATVAPAVFAQTGAVQAAPSAQVPQPDPSGVNWKGVGVGAGTVAGNILYIPAKLVYGILGGLGGGAGYALTGGNEQVANTIWRSSLGGDYVLTPDMITGKQPVHFSGPTQTAQPAPAAAKVSTPPTSFASAAGAPRTSSETLTHPIDSGAGPLYSSAPLSSEVVGGTESVPVKSLGATAKSVPPASSTSIE